MTHWSKVEQGCHQGNEQEEASTAFIKAQEYLLLDRLDGLIYMMPIIQFIKHITIINIYSFSHLLSAVSWQFLGSLLAVSQQSLASLSF